jgi:hypothetical protein
MTCFDRDPAWEDTYSEDGIHDSIKKTTRDLERVSQNMCLVELALSDLTDIVPVEAMFFRAKTATAHLQYEGFCALPLGHSLLAAKLQQARQGDLSSRTRRLENLHERAKSLADSLVFAATSFARVPTEGLSEGDTARAQLVQSVMELANREVAVLLGKVATAEKAATATQPPGSASAPA